MKPTNHVIMLAFCLYSQYSFCSKPAKPNVSWKSFEAGDKGSLQKLAELRVKRHENRLKEKKFKAEYEEGRPAQTIVPIIEKPARGCCGCLSRTYKLVVSLYNSLAGNN